MEGEFGVLVSTISLRDNILRLFPFGGTPAFNLVFVRDRIRKIEGKIQRNDLDDSVSQLRASWY